eukprot:XP_012820916.1 PREDICTED: collagen alpha-1(I) chain-like [Xenopus tropicalis]
MSASIEEMLARIRAEAEKRGDEWLRQLLPSQQDQPPTTPTRRSRRSRPPSRLSPSPPTRRRRPASPSPQPSTSGSPGLQRATRRSRIPAGTPPSGRQEPATPTGRARSGGSSARRRSRGPGVAREDHVEEASDAEEGVPGRIGTPGTSRRLRGQASNGPGGSQEDRSATRAGQGDAPGPREGGGARRRGQETRMAGAPMQGGAPAVSFTPERVGGTATAQTAWGTAPQAAGTTEGRLGAGGPATGGAWAYSHDPDTRGGTAAAQAAWGRPGADTAANSWGAGGPAGATQGGPTPAGLPGCGPPTPSRPAGAGLGQATGDMMEGTRAVPGNAAAGWEGTTAALTVAAQGMPPPLCIPQVYRSESGGAATAQHPRGTSQETTGRDSAISNHNDSAGMQGITLGPDHQPANNTPTAATGDRQTGGQPMAEFMESLRKLIGQWDGKSQTSGGAPSATAVSPAVGMSTQGLAGVVGEGSGPKRANKPVPISDSAKGHAYICFEGPLGSHLKPEVREKIWKREYVDIFTLLPLERFNIDKYEKGKGHRKEEDEDRRRFRLIPRTFGNWLQAFAILASVVGEKHPEHCSALFCYLDGIWEAHRVYGGIAWLRYDEQFRQRMAVRQDVCWDHRDIGLWMRLMNNKGYQGYGGPGAVGQQPFPGSSSGQASSPAGAHKKGVCWLYNDSHCKWGLSCRFKHECSLCAEAHPLSRCFKKGKGAAGKARDGFGKGPDSSETRGDASMAK